jgi:hypothetical protein
MVIESRAGGGRQCLLQRLRPLGQPSSSRIRVLEANSGCSASIWALPSTTAPLVQVEDLLALGDEDVEQLRALRLPASRAARRPSPDLAEGEPAEALVEDPGDLVHRRHAVRAGTSTKIVRTTPLRRLNTRSSARW